MHSIFDLVFEHQRIRALERAGAELAADDRALKVGLDQLLRGDRAESRLGGVAPVVDVPATVRLALGGTYHVARVRDVSGSGITVRARVDLPVGQRLLIEVRDSTLGELFLFPAVVTWRAGAMASLRFDGAASRRLARDTVPPSRATSMAVAAEACA